jgi:hypothetical protein
MLKFTRVYSIWWDILDFLFWEIALDQIKKHSLKYCVPRINNFLSQVRKDLAGKPLKDAPEEKELAVCWKTAKPIKSILDIKSYFKPLTISFMNAKNVQLQLAPEDYLIITVSTSRNNFTSFLQLVTIHLDTIYLFPATRKHI